MVLETMTFLCVFTVLATGGLLLSSRQRKSPISAILENQQQGATGYLRGAWISLSTLTSRLGRAFPKTPQEVSVLQRKLIRAGFREDSAVRMFYGAKVIAMAGCVILVFVTRIVSFNYFMAIAAALGGGFLAPDFWLMRKVKSRQAKIRSGLPDVLDLLVVCVEAGLSLDQAVSRAAQELGSERSAIADEFAVIALEQRAGCPRAEAWKHLANRTNVESVQHLVSMVAQSEKLGTSIAKTLRIHSQALRTQRIQEIQEKAAKTGIKILFPLVLCILPNLFLVVLGPTLMLTLDSLRGNMNH